MRPICSIALTVLAYTQLGDAWHIQQEGFTHNLRPHSAMLETSQHRWAKFLHRLPPSGSTSKTTHESWLQKMGNSFWAVVIGFFMICVSFPVMWANERRIAKYESLIKIGQRECLTVEPDKSNSENRGSLVHVQGKAEGKAPVVDRRFKEFNMEAGCLLMRSTVEVYQWVETQQTESKKDNVGGGTTNTTTYKYSKQWTSTAINSIYFNERDKVNTVAKPDMRLGTETATCDLVFFGDGFTLTPDLVNQLTNFSDAQSILGDSVGDFKKQGTYFCFPEHRSQPEIGDMRAKFEYILDSTATVMALQLSGRDSKDTFAPYRMISRGLCGLNEMEQKRRQLIESAKTPEDLYKDSKCTLGPLDCLLCCCVCIPNCVNYCFSGMAPPQIFHLFPGSLSTGDCWNRIEASVSAQKWILRLVGWLLLFVGLMSMLQPLFTVLDIVPFLGPYLSSAVWLAAFVVAFILTLAGAFVIMSIAYLVYRPLVGATYLLLAAALVGISVALTQSDHLK